MLWWLVLPEKRTDVQTSYLERLTQRCPEIATATDLILRFFQLARERLGAELPEWEQEVHTSGIPELIAFCRSLRKDWDAVVAGLSLPWSNGRAEGHINRLKLVKRQMFGRANQDLLRVRFLPLPDPTG